MSLKALHIIFIMASIALSLFFGLWSAGFFGSVSQEFRGMGIVSFVLSGVLCAYLFFFISKMRKIKTS